MFSLTFFSQKLSDTQDMDKKRKVNWINFTENFYHLCMEKRICEPTFLDNWIFLRFCFFFISWYIYWCKGFNHRIQEFFVTINKVIRNNLSLSDFFLRPFSVLTLYPKLVNRDSILWDFEENEAKTKNIDCIHNVLLISINPNWSLRNRWVKWDRVENLTYTNFDSTSNKTKF